LFTAGSWLYWKSAHRTFLPVGDENSNPTTWWITVLNFAGSLGFMFQCFLKQPLFGVVPHGLKPNWLELVIGNVAGNVSFLVGSYLMVYQLAKEAE